MFKKEEIVKTVFIEGMSCMHCAKKVEDALNNLKGISAKVELEKKQAIIKSKKQIDNKLLKNKIEELGYIVTKICF